MDLSLTQEHEMVAKMVRDFAEKKVAPVIYEGTSQIHTLMQAGYALGQRQDRPLRCELPAYDPEVWQG